MNEKIKRELKVFIPIFTVLVAFSVALANIMPEKVPTNFNILGYAQNLIPKASQPYHIPFLELFLYVLITFFQFYESKINQAKESFLFQSKIAIVLVVGLLVPLAQFLYALEILPNIWYLMVPVMAFLIVFLVVLAFNAGLIKTRKDKKQEKRLKWRKRKKK